MCFVNLNRFFFCETKQEIKEKIGTNTFVSPALMILSFYFILFFRSFVNFGNLTKNQPNDSGLSWLMRNKQNKKKKLNLYNIYAQSLQITILCIPRIVASKYFFSTTTSLV